jgi:penicillin-binding protein 1A
VVNRKPITLDEVSMQMKRATIAIEDHRFYEHPGVDILGIGRAVYANLRGSALRQGASTLTQQLVRQPGFAQQFGLSREKRFSRKIREAFIALRMEQLYSKDQILQYYLNTVYYGSGAYGVQAASLTYFGKSAHKLNLAEAALLAGLPQSPSQLTPFSRLQAVINRRNEVLNRMQEVGFITAQECEKAKAEKPRLMYPPRRRGFNFKAPYFTTYVWRDLIRRYGQEYVESGLRIDTTLNWKIQQAAEDALINGLNRFAYRNANQGALVAIDPHTGYVRAMVGGRSFQEEQYNAVTQGRRQPGSTFKIFDYAAAFETTDLSLYDSVSNASIRYPGDPRRRVVQGSGERLSVLAAIQFSKNAAAVRVAQQAGIQNVIAYAKKMGITTELQPYLSTALGASEVRPIDLCSAYSVIPNGGDRCPPMTIVKITDAEGNIVKEFTPTVQRGVLKSRTVEQLDKAFEAVVTGGTGTKARSYSGSLIENARGKTGTTDLSRDVWFAGYTPELTAVVWVANVRKVGKRKVYAPMPGSYGGEVCAPIWHNFMIQAIPEQRRFRSRLEPVAVETTKPDEPKKRRRSDRDSEPVPANLPATSPQTPAQEQTPAELGRDRLETAPGPIAPSDRATDRPSTPMPEPVEETARPRPSVQTPITPTASQLRAAVPTPEPPRPPPRPPEPEMVSVIVCEENGLRANTFCPVTNTIRVTPARASRMRRCNAHRPPPGEG